MTDFITAVYEISGADARARATAVAVEQSHELPTELAPESSLLSLGVVTDFEDFGARPARATVRYPSDLAGGELAQLLVLLLGNVSLQDGVRLVGVDFSESLAAQLGGGTTLGASGVRRVLDVPERPLLATALKPVGLSAAELAAMAGELALGGIDLIKDDQGLANQVWAPYRERVLRATEAVREANAQTSGTSVYLPAVAGRIDEFDEKIRFAADSGAGGVLLMPGVSGFDAIRRARQLLPADSIIMAHPSFLGGFTAVESHGISPDVLFGSIMRAAGADVVIFPSSGGRFSFTLDQCRQIGEASRSPLAGIPASLPAPGGGMSIDKIPALVELYGSDVALLIGADLHRGGDLWRSAERFREAAVAAS